jgi:hypothetical protein
MDKRKLSKLVNQMDQLNSNLYTEDIWLFREMKETISKMREELAKPDNPFPESVQSRIELERNSPR